MWYPTSCHKCQDHQGKRLQVNLTILSFNSTSLTHYSDQKSKRGRIRIQPLWLRSQYFSLSCRLMRIMPRKYKSKQVCIPVGCVPAAHWPYAGGGGCLLPGGASFPGGGASLWGGGAVVVSSMHWGRPPLNRITDTSKNITLPQLRCRR